MSTNKQTKGLHRNTVDKYYTNSDTVKLCLEFVSNNIRIQPNDLIIEPSAGNGAFICGIKKLTSNYVFYDILPEHDDIEQQDYLLLTHSKINVLHEHHSEIKIHVIGNPPFGRQSSIANKFIKKSCEFCDTISFILPRSFTPLHI